MNHTLGTSSMLGMLMASLLLVSCNSSDKPRSDASDTLMQEKEGPEGKTETITKKELDPIPADCPRYSGTVDTLAVEMQLCRKNDELYGRYRYLKIGRDIEIQGHVEENGDFILYEWGNGPKRQTGQFLGTFGESGEMTGEWVSADGKRTLKFALQGPAGDSAAVAADTSKFNGEWRWEGREGAVFTLSLRENGRELSGYHCSVTSSARRVDCSNPDDPVSDHGETVRGTINGRNASVTFESTYGVNKKGDPVQGQARIIRSGDSLIWRIVGESTGEHWLPYNVTLKRDASRAQRK